MRYQVLRNCYAGEVFRRKGDVLELPDELVKDPANFRPLGEAPTEEEQRAPAAPREPGEGEYRCSKCESNHKETSKLGKRHLALRV